MDPTTGSLDLTNLTVQHGDVVALNGVTVSARSGERIALIGPSGAGKSTLLHTAAGLVTPRSGTVEVLGSRLDTLSGSALRRHRRRVGLVSQDLGLAPSLRVVHSVNGGRLGTWSTPKALLSLARPSGRSDIADVLSKVGLKDRIDARTGDLSGGEQQRVAVARTLIQRPNILLADEPTSSVDPELANQVMALICDRDAPWTALVSVHDPDLALRHADRVIALSNGTVAFDRPVAEVTQADISTLYERT